MPSHRTLKTLWIVPALLATLASACLAEEAATASLYERLGGEAAITAVVEDFVGRAAGDPAVNFTRQGTGRPWEATPENVAHLKKGLIQFICAATGGPQAYEGKDMRSAHAGMGITDAEFDALAADLKASLAGLGVPEKEQGELLAIVSTTRGDIVESAPAAAPEAAEPTAIY